MNNCITCNQETRNPRFCSRSCAAKYNNIKFPKRSMTRTCPKCNSLIPSGRVYCYNCYDKHEGSWMRKTIEETRILNSHKMTLHTIIRQTARRYYFKHHDNVCKSCGYDKHVEVCHIIPINLFDGSALLGTVNSLDNLIGLCPNCHWELDNGLLSIRGLDYTLTIDQK